MGKLTVIGLVWLLLFAVTLILIDEQLSGGNFGQTSDGAQEPQDQDSGTPSSGFVALQVDGYLVDDFWERGADDLPVLVAAVNYVVRNVGNASADVVTVEITLDSEFFSTETVNNLLPDAEYANSVSFSLDYDKSKTVEIEAFSGNATAYWNYTVDAELPRQPPRSMMRLFVTPDEQSVESAYDEIMGGIVFVHWIAIRDWVGRNIDYVDDYEAHGVNDFWQLSEETLESRTGDSEDFAILLCSLLRRDGWSAEDVYVVIGQNEHGDFHAWVKIKIPMVGWYNIEPQQGGWYTLFGDYVALHGYTAVYNFNDQYFKEI